MRIRRKLVRQVIQVAEAIGIDRGLLLAGLDPELDPSRRDSVDWTHLAALCERTFELVGHDVDTLRKMGRAMVRSPLHAFLQGFARGAVSLSSLYEGGARWAAPTTLPLIELEVDFPDERRVWIRGRIPEPYAPTAAFFHIFEGSLVEIPTLLGLPPATIVQSTVTPRTLDIELDLPPSRSLFRRVQRTIRAALDSGDLLELLEQQRSELAAGLESVIESNHEIRALFEGLPDLVIIHRDGLILWVNRAVLKLFGYAEPQEIVGRQLLDIVAPASRDLVRGRMRGQADGTVPELIECWLLARDGTSIPCEVSPSQIVVFGGKPARLVVGRDTTERMRMQQQLLTADRMASIGMLAAGVAHEVNNPLAYVLNNVEIAIRALTPLGESTRASREALAVALEGVDRIRVIVRDLLVLSRVDDRAVGPLDVRAVVESTLALAANKISERADLTCVYEPVPLARGTAARLGQVILNLVANAIEAMPEGTRATNELRVMVHESGGRAVVEVSDNGVGILPEHVGRVFDPFFTTKAFGAGTGLGLAISQRLVTEIGGELSFDSTPQRGSTFRVALPPSE